MSLQEKLDARKNELESAVPKDVLEIMHRATQDLETSELMNRVKKEGDTVPEDLQGVYKKLGIDVSQYNDDGSWQLPMPARYIIDRDKVIRYAAVNADYMVRPDPSETIAALERISA